MTTERDPARDEKESEEIAAGLAKWLGLSVPLAAVAVLIAFAAFASWIDLPGEIVVLMAMIFAAPWLALRLVPWLMYLIPRAGFLLPAGPVRRAWIKILSPIRILEACFIATTAAMFAVPLGAFGAIRHWTIERYGVPGTALIEFKTHGRGGCSVTFQYQHERDYAPLVDETMSAAACARFEKNQKTSIHYVPGHFFAGWATLD